jgi:AbrB family looped-hinge helix DNA binding protein
MHSMVSVDERGQMVLPKAVRESAGIAPGDKLALVTWERGDEVCCLVLLKADRIAEFAKGLLEPLFEPDDKD